MEILKAQDINISRVISLTQPKNNLFENIKYSSEEESILMLDNHTTELINGVGLLPRNHTRIALFDKFNLSGYRYKSIISDDAIISSSAKLGEGVHIMAGAIIQADAIIADNVIINTGAIIEHDCIVGKHSHIAPGAVLCGGVTIEGSVYIGANSTIIQNIKIAENSIIGAGTVINKDIDLTAVIYPPKNFIKEGKYE